MSDRKEQQRQAIHDIPEADLHYNAYIEVTATDELTLDGEFTVGQLKRIVTAMESVP